jgi:hypothetical protein
MKEFETKKRLAKPRHRLSIHMVVSKFADMFRTLNSSAFFVNPWRLHTPHSFTGDAIGTNRNPIS